MKINRFFIKLFSILAVSLAFLLNTKAASKVFQNNVLTNFNTIGYTDVTVDQNFYIEPTTEENNITVVQPVQKVESANNHVSVVLLEGYAVSSGASVTDPQNTYYYDEIDVCTIKHVIDVCKIFARIIAIFKILTPVILVIVSTKSLAEAVLDENETDLKKYTRVFIQRFILGVFIAFLPTLLSYILTFTMGNSYKTVKNNYAKCINCVLDINSCPEDTDLYVVQTNGVDDTFVQYNGSQQVEDCNSLFGDSIDANDIAYYIQLAFTIIKILGIAFCIVFSVVDIFKAILGGDKDMYKPVVGKIIKRLVYVAVLLFLPQIIDVLMTVTGMYSSCNIN